MYELREKKEEGTKKPVWKKAAACILALLLFFACSALLYVTKLATSTQKIPDADIKAISNDYLNEATEKQMDDYWTVAIFGVDSRNGNIGKGTSADTQMLLTLNRANGEIRLVSVYRDTLLMLSLIHISLKGLQGRRLSSGSGPDRWRRHFGRGLGVCLNQTVSWDFCASPHSPDNKVRQSQTAPADKNHFPAE